MDLWNTSLKSSGDATNSSTVTNTLSPTKNTLETLDVAFE
jgi:hypothetical protein